MVSNKDLQDYESFREKNDSALNAFLKKTSPEAIIGLIGLVIVGYYFISKTDINPYVAYGGIILLFALIIWRMGKAKELTEIPLETIRILAVNVIERSVGFVYPRGTTVQPGKYAKMVYDGDWATFYKAWKWEVGVMLHFTNGLQKEIRVLMNPYTGFCIGVHPADSGYTGLEPASRDRKIIIPTNEFQIKNNEQKKQ